VVLILVIAVVVVIGAPVLFKLSEQAKNFPAFSIGISFSQTLGLFSIQLDYPPYLRHLLSYFSFFNLNLELVHPECSLGSWNFSKKWMAGTYTRPFVSSI